MTTSTDAPRPTKSFFGHPRALLTVAGVEMWERFSFYGMQGILAIYMYYTAANGGLGIDEATALGIVGAYGGAVYLFSILGAWIADRVLGSERTLFYSAIIIMLGHLALSLLPNVAGLVVGLILIAFGSGGLKSNATAVVGTLYEQGDNRRDAGFSIFYMGINVGALIGPLLTGLLQSEIGFHWGFGLAAVGMALGLAQYVVGRKDLAPAAFVVPNPLKANERLRYILLAVIGLAIIVALVLSDVITAENLSNTVIIVVIAASVVYFLIILTNKSLTAVERSRVYAFIPLWIASVAFWSLYQQQFTVMAYYSDKQLNRDIFGWTMPVSWVNSINPIFIIVLAGVFAALWVKWGDRQPSTPAKLAFGTATVGVAFLLFIPFAGGAANSTPLMWIVLILFIFTIAELMLSPVGMSLTTKLAPAKFQTQMVALWFLSVSLGTAITGKLAGVYTAATDSADPKGQETLYFGVLGIVAIAVGLVIFLARKPILKLMAGVK